MQTCTCNRKHTANKKDPQAPLGMTIQDNAHLTFAFIPLRRRLPLRGSLSSAFGAPLLQGSAQLSCKSSASKNNETRIPRIVISSGARNLPCTPVKQRAWDDDKRNTPSDASDNDTKKRSSHITSPHPALNPSPLYAKIELSLISLLIKSIAGIGFS